MELDAIAGLQQVPPLLRQRGYSDEDVRAIIGGNAVRFFAAACPSPERPAGSRHAPGSPPTGHPQGARRP